MYGIIYTSSQYYDNNTQLDELDELDELNESNKECIICWLPSSKDTPVKCVKDNSFYVSNCKCNAFFHDICLQKWLNNRSSCPNCRSNIHVKHIENNDFCIKITTYAVILLNNTLYVFKMLSFFSTINLFLFIICRMLFLSFSLIEDQDECRNDF